MDNHVAEAHSAAVAAREAAETDHQRSYTALVEAEEQEDATEAAVMKARWPGLSPVPVRQVRSKRSLRDSPSAYKTPLAAMIDACCRVFFKEY